MYRRSLTRQINYQATGHSLISSIAQNLVDFLQVIVQPEEPQIVQPHLNSSGSDSPNDPGSVIFSSNEFLTMHLLTDCYESDV